MAFGTIGAVGIGQDVTNSSSYTVATTNSNLSAGNFILLFNVTDNTSTTDGDNNEHTSVTGGTGTWTKLGEYTNSNGSAAAGVTVSLFYFESTGTNNIGTTFTLNFASNRVEKCCALRAFTKASGTVVAISAEPGTNPITSQVDAAADFGSSSFSGLGSTERLYVRAMGKEGNVVTALTPSSGFTIVQANRSQNAASAVIVRGEFRINTSTGETSNPTQALVGDTAGLFFALVEKITGTLSKTLDAITVSSTGQLLIQGTLSSTLDAITLSSQGTLPIRGGLVKTLDDFTLSSQGQLLIQGTLSKTLDAITITSTGLLSGLLDVGAYAGICHRSGSCDRTGSWYVSPTHGINATGDGGFVLEDSASGPLGATVHSQAFQLGVDPDFWFSWWIQPASNPATNPRVLWCHEMTASVYCAFRQKTDGKLEWVKNVGAGEVVILTSTSAVSLTDPTHVLINMHGGVTSLGINGAWEASATDHTDYSGFSSGVGSGTVRFLEAAVSGDNYVGKADDIKAKTGAYYTVATVGNTYPIPATSP